MKTTHFATSLALALAAPALAFAEVPEFPATKIGGEERADLPNVVVIDTAGTISSRAETRISYLKYQGTVEGGVQQILEDLYPELGEIADITVVDLAGNGNSLGSSVAVSTQTLYNVSRTVDKYLADPNVDAIVVTAGTNVMEEDAYFLDLTVRSDKPVVMTGSMHQYGTFTYDGYTNLFSSVRLAASQKTKCFGTVVLMNDQVFPARDVTKMDGYRMDTFGVDNYGALGVVNQDNIRIRRIPVRALECGTENWATPFDLSKLGYEDIPAVDIISGHIESTAGPLKGAVEGGSKGIVVSGHGPGGLSNLQNDARDAALEAGIVMVSTSRTGGEGNYENGGKLIGGADLLPQKARILLQLSLAFAQTPEDIREWFKTIGANQL